MAITLLALDLRVPDPSAPGSLAHRLAEQWPNYAAYVVSFVTIGIIWINHHATLRRLVSVDHTILVLNLVLLLTIGVLPFSTALMAEYLKAAHDQNLAAMIYGGSFLVMSLAFFVMQQHMLLAKQHLLHERLTPDVRRATGRSTPQRHRSAPVRDRHARRSAHPRHHARDLRSGRRVLRARPLTSTKKRPRRRGRIRPVRDLLGRRSKRGRAVRLVAAVAFGLLCAQALHALAVSRDLWAIPISVLVACLRILPRHPN